MKSVDSPASAVPTQEVKSFVLSQAVALLRSTADQLEKLSKLRSPETAIAAVCVHAVAALQALSTPRDTLPGGATLMAAPQPRIIVPALGAPSMVPAAAVASSSSVNTAVGSHTNASIDNRWLHCKQKPALASFKHWGKTCLHNCQNRVSFRCS